MAYKYETVTLPIPIGGLNTRDEPTLMNRGQTPELFNIELDSTQVKKRGGYSQMGGTLSGIGMDLIQYVDGQGVVHLIALTTTNAYVYDASAGTWDKITPQDAVPADVPFTGIAKDYWSWTVAHNPSDFTANGGTALIISNGVDKPQYYEGDTGDKFTELTVSTELAGFAYANTVNNFWNHLFLINYSANPGGTDYVRSVAFHDVSTASYSTLGITEVNLTDTKGQLRRAIKLGFDMILYSDLSITICRRLGGISLFTFPTVIYSSGLYGPKTIYDDVNRHFFMGTDQKIYSYTGGTQLQPIGDLVEYTLFRGMDVSQREYIAVGNDQVKHKIYFFYPTIDTTYSKKYIAYNYDLQPVSWEQGQFANSVASFSIFSNESTWAYDGPEVAGKAFTDEAVTTMAFVDGNVISGFPQTVFLSREGKVYRFTDGSSSDAGSNIEAWYTTPDLIPEEFRTDKEARWAGFNISAKTKIEGSTITVSYSTNGTDEYPTWTEMDTITLTKAWTQYRIPVDVKAKKIRFKVYQNSTGDFQVRSQSYKVQLATDK